MCEPSEIFGSKEALESEHGLKIYALAYPNGDYSHREVELLQSAGYTCGLTLEAGLNDAETDPFRLRRVALPDDAGINEVIVKVSGLWTFLKVFGSKSPPSAAQFLAEPVLRSAAEAFPHSRRAGSPAPSWGSKGR